MATDPVWDSGAGGGKKDKSANKNSEFRRIETWNLKHEI